MLLGPMQRKSRYARPSRGLADIEAAPPPAWQLWTHLGRAHAGGFVSINYALFRHLTVPRHRVALLVAREGRRSRAAAMKCLSGGPRRLEYERGAAHSCRRPAAGVPWRARLPSPPVLRLDEPSCTGCQDPRKLRRDPRRQRERASQGAGPARPESLRQAIASVFITGRLLGR